MQASRPPDAAGPGPRDRRDLDEPAANAPDDGTGPPPAGSDGADEIDDEWFDV